VLAERPVVRDRAALDSAVLDAAAVWPVGESLAARRLQPGARVTDAPEMADGTEAAVDHAFRHTFPARSRWPVAGDDHPYRIYRRAVGVSTGELRGVLVKLITRC